MTIKMVVTDMDGTFLNAENTYEHDHFKQLFQKMTKAGIKFVAASGSQYQRLQNQFAEVATQMDFVSQNGAIVHSGNDLVSVDKLSDADLATILRILAERFEPGAIMQQTISGLRRTYVDATTPKEVVDVVKRYYSEIELVPDLPHLSSERVHDAITKVGVTFGMGGNFAHQAQTLRAALPKTVASQNSGFQTELIGNAGIDKVTGIKQLQERYGIATDEIATFGDNENDLAMLKMTPYGFAMQNAAPEFKQQVKNVTVADNNHNGVLKTIETIL
ncbi:HAD-IIB family hydrolase [Lentilactobacillus senioris]|uniref:HAD-IIB family hydrolase n=1 Tax=Lentilactobacillus senioris TaxID=931534 RepID=UPI003D28FD85